MAINATPSKPLPKGDDPTASELGADVREFQEDSELGAVTGPIARRGRRVSTRSFMIFLVFFALSAFVLAPTFLVLLIGMVPTLITFLFDTSETNYQTKTVGWLNATGCAVVIVTIWEKDHSLATAIEILLMPGSLGIIYVPALIGWGLIAMVRPLARGYLTIIHNLRLRGYMAERSELIRAWGPDLLDGLNNETETRNDHPVVRDVIKEDETLGGKYVRQMRLGGRPVLDLSTSFDGDGAEETPNREETNKKANPEAGPEPI